jgi:hypothetical protein
LVLTGCAVCRLLLHLVQGHSLAAHRLCAGCAAEAAAVVAVAGVGFASPQKSQGSCLLVLLLLLLLWPQDQSEDLH